MSRRTFMLTSSNRSIFHVTGPLWGQFTGHRWFPPQWPAMRSFGAFFICAWTNDWVNNPNIGDLRRNCAHYDFTVMLGEMLWIGVVFQAMSQGDMANRHHWIRSYYTHYSDAIMGPTASQITSLTIVTQPFIQAQIKKTHQSSASLAFVRGINRGTVNSPHKWPVTRKMFPFDDVIMIESWVPDK